TSCESSLQNHGKQEVLSQNCSTVQIQAVHGVPYVPHCSLCLPGTGGTGTGFQVPLAAYAGKLVMSSRGTRLTERERERKSSDRKNVKACLCAGGG
ncbi:hypothetical protein KUCAC02_021176, partial [Chaenocephalus aceratus]